ncbi:AraC family transcriptional regulator [Paenibacillus alkaliterrae]|uniref:helix-turn-helix transcriptional regulator n=1 Tax=Paenibacillus alkaliterrae TaxID=320909 RepID=UPI001F2EAF1F|nr:AraC family transcriptional regulator [Paenibacillus alkaliterrae]MCF2937962.1 AraC family transcriptional regulator [Paenibacillus alkaliterrae]
MNAIVGISPIIRVAHHYKFHHERTTGDVGRYGYCYAFHFVESGRGQITVPPNTYSIQKGDLIYLPPEREHSFHFYHEDQLATYNVYCELWSDRPFATESHLTWDLAKFDSALLTHVVACTELEHLPAVIPLQHHDGLAEIFAHIVQQHQKKDVNSDVIAGSLLKAFVLEVVQVAQNKPFIDPRIKIIMERIEKEAHASCNYESWLKLSGLKKSQFHQLFKQTTNMSPKAFWTKTVMKQAAVSLLENNLTITELSNYLGYSSIHHFTKQFTSYYGVSPTSYRKKQHFV